MRHCQLGPADPGQVLAASCCGLSFEFSVTINGVEFLVWLNDYQLLEKQFGKDFSVYHSPDTGYDGSKTA